MNSDDQKADQVEKLLDTPDLAGALESEQFKKFLDQVPIAICVSELPRRVERPSFMQIPSSSGCQA